MGKEWTKFLNQIISGTVSGLIVVLAQKGLEWRIKKLEKKDKEIGDYLKSKKAVRIFREMHINNSKLREFDTGGVDQEWRTLAFDWKYNKESDHYFREIKKILSKTSMDDGYSFVVIYSHKQHISSERNEWINWEKYKEILRKSDSYFNYFENLKKESNKLEGCCNNVLFTIDKLNYLCSKVAAEIL